jgi:hypothetical protein
MTRQQEIMFARAKTPQQKRALFKRLAAQAENNLSPATRRMIGRIVEKERQARKD